MEEIVITSLDRNLANDLQAEGIKDISVGRQISTMDCANPEIMAQMNSVVTLVVSGASTIALSLFSSWLYERLRIYGDRHRTRKLKKIPVKFCAYSPNLISK